MRARVSVVPAQVSVSSDGRLLAAGGHDKLVRMPCCQLYNGPPF
eukprot:COSAG01_NODE_5147_length_4453_cov_8.549209_4_plen_44_part_00